MVSGRPAEGSPGTLGVDSLSPLDSSFFITAVVALFSPLSPFLTSNSFAALRLPEIPFDIFPSPFSTLCLAEEEEDEEDFLLLKGTAALFWDFDSSDPEARAI